MVARAAVVLSIVLLGLNSDEVHAQRSGGTPVVLIAATAVASTLDVPAGEVTCGWCRDDVQCFEEGVGFYECHWFPDGGDECGIGGDPEAECSRCGGTSECHTEPDDGDCHLECGPGGGELAALLRELDGRISGGDVHGVASLVRGNQRLVLDLPRNGVAALPECGGDGVPTFHTMKPEMARRVLELVTD